MFAISHIRRELPLVALLGLLALTSGNINGFTHVTAFGYDLHEYGALRAGYFSFAFTIAGLTGIVAAVLVDLKLPYIALPVGTILVAIGLSVSGLASGYPQMVTATAIVGSGIGFIGPKILFALTAKGCIRLRGTAIGSIALLGGLGAMPAIIEAIAGRIGSPLTGFSAAAVFVLMAVILRKKLPSMFPPCADGGPAHPWRRSYFAESQANVRTLLRKLVFWKAIVGVGMVFGFGRGLVVMAQMTRPQGGHDLFEVLGVNLLGPLAGGFVALIWGIAADRVPAKGLMVVAAGIAVVSSGALMSGWVWATPLALVMLGIVSGAVVVLPWVMLADYIGTKYMATIGIALAPLSVLPIMVGPILHGQLMDWGWSWAAPAIVSLYALGLFAAVSSVRRIEHPPNNDAILL